MVEPTDEDIDRRAKENFEAENRKDTYWDLAGLLRIKPHTPLVLSEAERQRYRDQARAELIKK